MLNEAGCFADSALTEDESTATAERRLLHHQVAPVRSMGLTNQMPAKFKKFIEHGAFSRHEA
jgi:hypothetical protein